MNHVVNDYFKRDTYAQKLGITIEKVDKGYAKGRMSVSEDMLNFHGTANGGCIFSLADTVFACASNSYGQTAVGITVTIHYLAAAKVGDELVAVATEDNKSNKLGLYRMEIVNQENTLLALAEGMVYRTKHQFCENEADEA
ncbi:hydroxyphenylacetyl-CoA thioesterase PaaI [Caldalkalibacillus salinus]|uniref:hydroxyphenylacetyl-CoA thioesterase PaaI n=1 Tax=Caldalkalibacillus salinus TaxID=2803787 RepID=UPI001924FA98|nr:hydroxyphenylacetyl-CoA thioesterase PaaI [Caldalkalibacillus salinus]